MENNSIKKRKSVSLVRELLLNEGPHSQASISRKTGLSPAMVNYVVKKTSRTRQCRYSLG